MVVLDKKAVISEHLKPRAVDFSNSQNFLEARGPVWLLAFGCTEHSAGVADAPGADVALLHHAAEGCAGGAPSSHHGEAMGRYRLSKGHDLSRSNVPAFRVGRADQQWLHDLILTAPPP